MTIQRVTGGGGGGLVRTAMARAVCIACSSVSLVFLFDYVNLNKAVPS